MRNRERKPDGARAGVRERCPAEIRSETQQREVCRAHEGSWHINSYTQWLVKTARTWLSGQRLPRTDAALDSSCPGQGLPWTDTEAGERALPASQQTGAWTQFAIDSCCSTTLATG
eukprot:358454-Chlamydomonas_euryale.AAC.4